MESPNFNRCRNCGSQNQKIQLCCQCRLIQCAQCKLYEHSTNKLNNHILTNLNEKVKIGSKSQRFKKFYFCREIYVQNFSMNNSFENQLVQQSYNFLIEQAQKGILLVSVNTLFNNVKQNFIENFNEDFLNEKLSNEKFKNVFKKLTRNLMNNKQIEYFSLKLNSFSIESLIWILKSLYIDELKPGQTLVQSRFKECFGFNIPGKDWNYFIRKIYNDKQKLKLCNKYQNFLSKIILKEIDQEIVLGIENMIYVYKDLSIVQKDDEDFQQFIKFIDNFFIKQKQNKFDLDLQENSEIFRLFKNKKNLELLLQEKQVSRAIPGGMYGCALLMKNSNLQLLQNASLGRLHALVKKALNEQILLHYKTLIIMNKDKKQFSNDEKQALINNAKQQVIQIIEENGSEGVTLAQLPGIIYEQFGIKYDFQKMGFPKLKNFLQQCPEIQLQNKKNLSHIKACLKKQKTKIKELNKQKTYYSQQQSNIEQQIKRKSDPQKPSQDYFYISSNNSIQEQCENDLEYKNQDIQCFNYDMSQKTNSFQLIKPKESVLTLQDNQVNFPTDPFNFDNFSQLFSFSEQKIDDEENEEQDEEFSNFQIEEKNRKFIDFILKEDNQFKRGSYFIIILLVYY